MTAGIVGAGAMGSIFSYFFHRAGITPLIYERNSSIVKSLEEHLTINIAGTSEKIVVNPSNSPEILKKADIIFIFVKSYHTRDAMQAVVHHLASHAIIVTFQNGIGNREIISEFVPDTRIVYGSTTIGAAKINDNTVSFGGSGDIMFGGADKESVMKVKALLDGINLNNTVSDNPDKEIWKKAIINAGINPLGALLGVPNGEIIRNRHAVVIQKALVCESVDVAIKKGIPLDHEQMLHLTSDVCIKTEKNRCSMLQDIESGRRTEIDSINGIIKQYGHDLSVPVPVNELIYRLVKAREELSSRTD